MHDPVYIEDGVTHRAERDRSQRLPRAGNQGQRQPVRNTIIGRDARLSGVELEGSLLGNGVVLENFRGSASLGDHSEAAARAGLMPNSSVDDLCRSYLDLKYHFDPAVGSSAGLVSADSRLGRFDAETTREHVSALRSVSGAVEELETGPSPDRDRPHGAAGRDSHHRLSPRETSSPTSGIRASGFPICFRALYSLLTRHEPEPAARAPAVLARLRDTPAFLEAAPGHHR